LPKQRDEGSRSCERDEQMWDTAEPFPASDASDDPPAELVAIVLYGHRVSLVRRRRGG